METLSRALEAIKRTAQSAQELLRDQELRSKAISGASSRLQGLQNGIVLRAGRLGERIGEKQRQLQSLLSNLEERLYSSQRQWQLQASRRQRVDVQFGALLITDAPQEVRARLWYVLLENPNLAAPLKCEHPGPVPNRLSGDGDGSVPSGDEAGGGEGSLAHMTANSSSSTLLAAAAAAALGIGRPSSGGAGTNSPSTGRAWERTSTSASDTPTRHPQQQQAPRAQDSSALSTPQQTRLARAEMAGAEAAGAGEPDGWELVGSPFVGPFDGAAGPSTSGAGAAAALPEAVRIIMERLEAMGSLPLDESGSDPVLVAQQAVLEAMLQVPWEAGVGLPPEVAPDSRFAMLNEMTAGQEEVDDSILRDIHRTFPEHPYFGLEAGRRSLFRVLKAYSLHDLEVAYCQGMAFMAGVLLMYVPEEMAFRLFCRLMEPEGPNLRRLYVPGLDPLKAELATFDLLLGWRLPELAAHLTEFGLPPVLYVSQWLMTLFATPFPPPFCARVIDVLLQDGHDRLLLRCSFAVMEALELELLARHDFEALITYLKMEPVGWGQTRQRAIMLRALNSPITDAEIDVARETIATRPYLVAAIGSGAAASATAAAALASGHTPRLPASAAEAEAEALAAVGAGALPPQLSFEAEVEAALAVTAATLMVGRGGEGGERAGGSGGAGGGPGAASTSGAAAGAGAGRGSYMSGNMISFEEDGEAEGAGAAAGARGGGAGGRGGDGGGTGGSALTPPAPYGDAYGSGSSLLDEYGDLVGSASTAMPYGASDVRHGPAPELEYGEYGEMLMDAGLLLPELGSERGAGAGPAGGYGDGAGGVTGHVGQAAAPLGRPSASGPAGGWQPQQNMLSDLLLD